jgi:hypothetical protein
MSAFIFPSFAGECCKEVYDLIKNDNDLIFQFWLVSCIMISVTTLMENYSIEIYNPVSSYPYILIQNAQYDTSFTVHSADLRFMFKSDI